MSTNNTTAAEANVGKTILIDAAKRETHHGNNGLKRLHRRLRNAYKVEVNKEPLTAEVLTDVSLIIFGGPREKFSSAEFAVLKQFLDQGGSVLFMLGEGGEEKYGTNVNFLLEEFGISFNNDSVARTVYYKYLHPKEVFIGNGVLNRGMAEGAKLSRDESGKENGGLEFVYPYGSTLNVQKPAVALLSSGHISYPLNRPVVACAQTSGSATWEKKGAGRIGVVGSVEMFSDNWLTHEDNEKVFDVLSKWLLGEGDVILDHADAEDPDVSDYHHVPNTEALAERLRSCLQEGEPLPQDFTDLFAEDVFKFDTNLIPEAVALYKTLSVKHEPLTLIPPQFEAPLPPLVPAVFPPAMREPPPPALDQFDLDEHFASERLRLAQLTNKCEDDDLEYYVRESGETLGVVREMGVDPEDLKGEHGAKRILEFMLRELVRFKKLNQDEPAGHGENQPLRANREEQVSFSQPKRGVSASSNASSFYNVEESVGAEYKEGKE
ncbi:Intraflagellar transport protein 52-like [Hondaea fermentalgiana]|uniref:Intraflagellar transport protein 52-like n=1 Tax=Hondaea fermentalgiana TaxID=2315210 RepID=A0A2R5GKM4_9STRA|nr:Intraflagellar transport protein 52-like [Hondaea fermentalgiana]|eukprot:GBG28831.1 Intraflagellar transport protein 52-like [Hondaea fermentalgiana]